MESYEEWDMAIPPLPSRSRLYCLEPIGVGTPYVESLTSYIARLAEMHCVFPGTLMRNMIVPLVPGYSPLEKQHGLFRESGERSTLINGAGLPATYALQVLQNLTLRTDLCYLTATYLAQVLSGSKLIRLNKAWCPICYEEWKVTGQTLYDPLLWSFREALVCIRHNQQLSMQCHYQDCSRQLPGLAWWSQIGYCLYCHRWLGLPLEQAQKNYNIVGDLEMFQQPWKTQTLGEVLGLISTRSTLLERQRVSQVVSCIAQQIANGNLALLARTLGLSRNMMDRWKQGERIPEIDMLLHFCFRLGLSLSDFLFHELDNLHPYCQDISSLVPVSSKKRRLLDMDYIYRELEKELACDRYPPLSMKEVIRRIGGYAPSILCRAHQAAYDKIVARYEDYIQQRKEARLQEIYREIEQIAIKLHSEKQPLTQKRIASYLVKPGVLKNPRIRYVLDKICHDVKMNIL